MPIYEYRCPECGNQFELKQSFTAESAAECPQCQAQARRKLSMPAIVFKGSGFYKTDSRAGSSDAKADNKAEGKVEAKTETKSAESTPDASSTGTSDTPSKGDSAPATAAPTAVPAPSSPTEKVA